MSDLESAGAVVRLERRAAHIALVTINRPQARNAINGAVAVALDTVVSETEDDPDIWVIVLTGAGGDAFCAGADLKDIAAGQADTLSTERGGFAGFVFRERSKPWIAAINGVALAGGTEIALACDLVVAAEHAAFGLPEVSRGLIAAAGGLFRLPRAIPTKIAIELILTAGRLDAQHALQYGLVNRLVPAERLLDAALALAAEITRNAPLAVRESLRIARQANELTEDELRALSRAAMARIRESDDFEEGPRAFIQKRAPQWRGR